MLIKSARKVFDMKFATKVVKHNYESAESGEVVEPIHLSTICSQRIPGEVRGYEYGRINNPTRNNLEKDLAYLENGKYAVLFSSGMSAINSVISTLNPGDEIICSEQVYEGTQRLLDDIFAKKGISTKYIKRESEIIENLTDATKLVWFESLSNPLLQIPDIKSIKEFIQGYNCKLLIDSSFTSPYCMLPLDLGADIIVESATKFLSGHHDLISGVVVTNNTSMYEEVLTIQQTTGNMLDPLSSYLLARGIKTLDVRLERQCNNAVKLSNWLSKQDIVSKVIFPGLESHPNYSLAKKQMKAYGAIISVTIDGDEDQLNAFYEKLKGIKISHSFGGYGTTIQVPRKMMNFSMSNEELDQIGITENMIRISVGLEHIEDIIADFESALTFM